MRILAYLALCLVLNCQIYIQYDSTIQAVFNLAPLYTVTYINLNETSFTKRNSNTTKHHKV